MDIKIKIIHIHYYLAIGWTDFDGVFRRRNFLTLFMKIIRYKFHWINLFPNYILPLLIR